MALPQISTNERIEELFRSYDLLSDKPKEQAQLIFSYVVEHLMAQSIPCKNGEGACVYKNDSIGMCAVGAIIPASIYSPSIEGRSLGGMLGFLKRSKGAELVRMDNFFNKIGEHLPLLIALQVIHDSAQPSHWEARLVDIAEAYDLVMPTFEGV